MSNPLIHWLLCFFIYSMAGWVWETCYVSFLHRAWVNRGFLYGPWLPLYGAGALSILWVTLPLRAHPLLVLVLGMVSATALEYVTGLVMERLFHVRYWDYSDRFCNLHGHICLAATLAWGLFSLLLVYLVQPPIESLLARVPLPVATGIVLVLSALFCLDAAKSIQAALNLKGLLAAMTEDHHTLERLEARLDRLRQQRRENQAARQKNRDYRRAVSLLRRNPGAISKKYRQALDELAQRRKKRPGKD